MDKIPHTMRVEEVFDTYKTTAEGLSGAEAHARLKKNGENVLKGKKKRSKWALFFGQFKDFMLIILLVAAIVTGIVALTTKTYSDLIDVGVILIQKGQPRLENLAGFGNVVPEFFFFGDGHSRDKFLNEPLLLFVDFKQMGNTDPNSP